MYTVLDTITCHDKVEAIDIINQIDECQIIDFVYLDDGKVRIYLQKGELYNEKNDDDTKM